MDVQLIATSVLDLPSSQRVDAIVHDGTTDLRVWPGPGPDRELAEHYGDELGSQLDRERGRLEGGELPIGGMLRLHRGKLHCDFLLWVATRKPEVRGVQDKAPTEAVLERAVTDALAFASERHVARIAFGPLGAGPDALPEEDRLVIVARAANAYYDARYAAGKPTGIEEVLVCHRSQATVAKARRALGRSVKVVERPAPAARSESEAPKRRRVASSSGPKRGTRRAAKPTVLDEDVIARARATAGPYDRTKRYAIGETMVHSKFGVGRVEEITPEGFIVVLFEGGETKRLLHDRP